MIRTRRESARTLAEVIRRHRPEIVPDVGINLWFTSFYRVMFERIREYGLSDQLVEMTNNVIIVDRGRPAERGHRLPRAVAG